MGRSFLAGHFRLLARKNHAKAEPMHLGLLLFLVYSIITKILNLWRKEPIQTDQEANIPG